MQLGYASTWTTAKTNLVPVLGQWPLQVLYFYTLPISANTRRWTNAGSMLRGVPTLCQHGFNVFRLRGPRECIFCELHHWCLSASHLQHGAFNKKSEDQLLCNILNTRAPSNLSTWNSMQFIWWQNPENDLFNTRASYCLSTYRMTFYSMLHHFALSTEHLNHITHRESSPGLSAVLYFSWKILNSKKYKISYIF